MYQALAYGVDSCYNERKFLRYVIVHSSQNPSIPRIERGGTSAGIVGRLPLVVRAAVVAYIPSGWEGEVARTFASAYIDIADSLRLPTTPKVVRRVSRHAAVAVVTTVYTFYSEYIVYCSSSINSSRHHPWRRAPRAHEKIKLGVQTVQFAPESDHVPDILLQEDSAWLSRIPPIRLPTTATIRTRYKVDARPNVFRHPHEHLFEVKGFHGRHT